MAAVQELPFLIFSRGEFQLRNPLKAARIIDRPNRFIVNLWLEGHKIKAHCPSTGTIGGFKLNDLPCLVSGPHGGARKTQYTIEAIGIPNANAGPNIRKNAELGIPETYWVGINQTRVNSYVEQAIIHHQLLDLFPQGVRSLRREVGLGSSRIDFLAIEPNGDRTYIEVKMPLKMLQLDLPRKLKVRNRSPSSTDRMMKQVKDMTTALQAGDRAVILTTFMYPNPGFRVPTSHSQAYSQFAQVLLQARNHGLQRWQVNFRYTAKQTKTLLQVDRCSEILPTD